MTLNNKPRNLFLEGMLGLAIGDAVGVPYEFLPRFEMACHPAKAMVGNGSHGMPAGTWSDDTSMALCIADSLCTGKVDTGDIMQRFLHWLNEGAYTADGEVFDYGNQVSQAMIRYRRGYAPADCGFTDEMHNGNGSLMRTLPISLWQCLRYGDSDVSPEELLGPVHAVSAVTHAHEIALICCGIFTLILRETLFFRTEDDTLTDLCARGFDKAVQAYTAMGGVWTETIARPDLFVHPRDIAAMPQWIGKSGGYVLDTLHCALWSLLTTDNYHDCVLRAVNLGNDTDTTAAVAGALCGVMRGLEDIPVQWLDMLRNRVLVEDICTRLNDAASRV